VRSLVGTPDQAVALLQKKLRPADAAGLKRARRLLEEIDSEDFATRMRASLELEKIGHSIEPLLRKALAGKVSLEVRARVKRLLARLRHQPLSPGSLRVVRAVEALERIDSSQTRKLLDRLGKGAEGSLLTEQARAALARLERSGR
jgi:hypothetical protein